MVKENPDFSVLLARMKFALRHASPWTGILFRSAPPHWASGRDLLTGAGSMKSGTRYNAPGTFPAIYGSTTPELAMIESLAYQRRAHLPVEYAMPLIFKAMEIRVTRSIDLTSSVVLTDLRVTRADLRREPWWQYRARGEESRSQAIGRAAHVCGLQALLFASAHTLDHGFNVVVLPDHIAPPSLTRVVRKPPKRS